LVDTAKAFADYAGYVAEQLGDRVRHYFAIVKGGYQVVDTPKYVKAAEAATRERNAGFMTVLLEGRYTDGYLAEAGGQTPRFTGLACLDPDRAMFLRACLGQLQRATAEACPWTATSSGAPRTTSNGPPASATASA
jgi:hypothetical protein